VYLPAQVGGSEPHVAGPVQLGWPGAQWLKNVQQSGAAAKTCVVGLVGRRGSRRRAVQRSLVGELVARRLAGRCVADQARLARDWCSR